MRHLHYKLGLLILPALLISAIVSLPFLNRTQDAETGGLKTHNSSPPAPALQVTGFNYLGAFDGTRTISIKADTLTKEKLKAAFFKLNLGSGLNLKNVIIDIYGDIAPAVPEDPITAAPKNGRFTSHDPAGAMPSAGDLRPRNGNGSVGAESVDGHQPVTFRNVFHKDTLSPLAGGRILTIRAQPVHMRLYQGGSLLTQAGALTASIQIEKRSILFKKQVEIVSGGRRLEGDRIFFFPDTATFKADKGYVLKTDDKRATGRQIRTDIFLRPIEGQEKKNG